MDAAIILASGEPVERDRVVDLPSPALVIAADGGLSLAAPLGLSVDLVVGDMDSVDPELLAAAEADGVAVERHDADKDLSDLELALEAAQRRGATQATVIGGAGGRFDHLLANIALLGRRNKIDIRWLTNDGNLTVIRHKAKLAGEPGDVVTLLALGTGAEGVTTTGLLWALDDERLEPGSTRGLSNQMTGPEATIQVKHGAVFAIQPRGSA